MRGPVGCGQRRTIPRDVAGGGAGRIGDDQAVAAIVGQLDLGDGQTAVGGIGDVRSVELPLIAQRDGALRRDIEGNALAFPGELGAGLGGNRGLAGRGQRGAARQTEANAAGQPGSRGGWPAWIRMPLGSG
jgi:hypothetical protein